MLVYLFLCKSFSTVLHDCWNSYNDIAAQIGMKRETVVQTVRALVRLGLIVRMQRRSKKNRRVFVDNHYSIV
ncbi:MAG: helix-turn-helix domain-containing protein, partial [Oscillospiraceae bacterium]|nr:helix-turn-helix domain-containing protein [Oscillospiraceae bacterium]